MCLQLVEIYSVQPWNVRSEYQCSQVLVSVYFWVKAYHLQSASWCGRKKMTILCVVFYEGTNLSSDDSSKLPKIITSQLYDMGLDPAYEMYMNIFRI